MTVTALALLACSRDHPRPRHVVLVTIDTLRADRLGLYGYRRPTSPFIDSLAADSTVFERAVPTSPSTAPSVASLLTGVHRASHGVRANGETLPEQAETVAEILKAHGFHTVARIANVMLDTPHGFAQGFDDFALPATLERTPPANFGGAPLVGETLRLLDGLGNEPFFLWLHFYDPHGPYYPPASYRAAFRAGDYRWPDEPAELPIATDRNALFRIPQYQVVEGARAPAAYRARYDAEVRYADDHVRGVVEKLRARGLWDDTLFILTADHGEGLGEHGYYFQHGWFTYDDCVHVPLVMRARGRLAGGRRVAQTVSLIDVAPTILELLGLPPAPEMEGRSLLALLDGEPGDRPAFAQSYHGTGRVALRRGRLKYIFTPARASTAPPPAPEDGPILPAEPHHELYDLVADPGEEHDLSTIETALTSELQAEVRAWLGEQHRRGEAVAGRTGVSGDKPRALDPLVEGQLRALGYVN
jgi:arylsulfatase